MVLSGEERSNKNKETVHPQKGQTLLRLLFHLDPMTNNNLSLSNWEEEEPENQWDVLGGCSTPSTTSTQFKA